MEELRSLVAPGSLFVTRHDKEGAAHGHDHHQRWHSILQGSPWVLSHGWPLNADAWDDQAKGEVEEETMTITDPLTVQVADLHGITRDIQSA